jgi:hypothetical protein
MESVRGWRRLFKGFCFPVSIPINIVHTGFANISFGSMFQENLRGAEVRK